jgi:hypothetical protein
MVKRHKETRLGLEEDFELLIGINWRKQTSNVLINYYGRIWTYFSRTSRIKID